MTVIDLPKLDGKNPGDIIKMEARRYVPLPISEVEIDWWVLPETLESEVERESGVGKKICQPNMVPCKW